MAKVMCGIGRKRVLWTILYLNYCRQILRIHVENQVNKRLRSGVAPLVYDAPRFVGNRTRSFGRRPTFCEFGSDARQYVVESSTGALMQSVTGRFRGVPG